jgi:hypothetical protein
VNPQLEGNFRNAYTQWYQALIPAIGGEDKIGTTTIPTSFVGAFRGLVDRIQKVARDQKVKLLILFIDEYISDDRASLVSACTRAYQQIGINWVDSGSSYILAHELIHALGKSAPGTPGAVTWTHNSPCQNALSTVARSSRDTIDLSGRLLELAEYREIRTNKGGGVLT